MNPDYAIFVFPRPWTWLSLVFAAISVTGWLVALWGQRQARRQGYRKLAEIAEPLVVACQRAGFVDEAAQMQRQIDRLRRGRSATAAELRSVVTREETR